jgi:hypothetical protein
MGSDGNDRHGVREERAGIAANKSVPVIEVL